jgi:hypothetical protein
MEAEAGVVDEDIHPHARLFQLGVNLLRGCRRREVLADDSAADVAGLCHFRCERLETLGVTCDQDEIIAVSCEETNEFGSDAAAGARDQRSLSVTGLSVRHKRRSSVIYDHESVIYDCGSLCQRVLRGER